MYLVLVGLGGLSAEYAVAGLGFRRWFPGLVVWPAGLAALHLVRGREGEDISGLISRNEVADDIRVPLYLIMSVKTQKIVHVGL